MRLWSRVRSWVRAVARRSRMEREMDAELRFHIEAFAEDLVHSGVPREEALRRARIEFGGVERAKEECREARGANFIESFIQDLRYGLRMLRRNPGFTAVAVITLALGIGANTAIFSVLYPVLLRPLPFPQPEQLVQLGAGLERGQPSGYVTGPQFVFCQDHAAPVFDSMAGFQAGPLLGLKQQDKVNWLTSQRVTEDFFRVIGVNPAFGRGFRREDMQPGAPLAVVLSDYAWRNLFGAKTDVVGTQLKLNEDAYTVIGVLPRGFNFVEQPTEVYVPLQFSDTLGDRGTNTRMIARLKPGVSIAQAQTDMNIVFQQFPAKNSGLLVGDYQRWLAGDFRASLILLFGATGLLLLLACLNVANLLLSRGSFRGREIFIRMAIGAGAARLLRQFLTEGLLLSLAGAAAGLLAAHWVLGALVSSIPFNFSWAGPVRIEGSVLLFTLGTLLVTTVSFGLASYWQTTRGGGFATAREEGMQTQTGASHGRVRSVLMTCEIALSFALLVGAALLGESLYRLYQEKLGFDPDNVVTMRTAALPTKNLTSEQMWNSEQQLLQRIQSLPGVRSASVVTVTPLTRQANMPVQVFGMDDDEHSFGGTEIRAISEDYFQTMRIPVLEGRAFLQTDGAGSLPVALVNETLARRWWKRRNPIGQRIVIGSYKGRKLFSGPEIAPREIVGVVSDVKGMLLTRPAPPMVYIPATQKGDMLSSSTAWVVRTVGRIDIMPSLRRALAELNPEQRVTEMRSMREVIAASIAGQSFISLLLGVFAGVALVLAAVGIYGVLSLVVAQRTHEIGIRMSLGAERRQVLKLFVGQGLMLALAGAGIGVVIALGLSRFLSSVLYQIRPTNFLPYVVAATVSIVMALLASYLPARRASRVDPMVALRYE